MSTSKTWPGGSTNVTPATYSIPAAGEVNWANLSNFLNALGDGAQSTTFQKFAVRVATTTPVTFSTNDCIVASNLTVPGAVAIALPAGSNKQIAFIVDRKGDAKTNNITITPNGAETINGSATLVLDGNNQGVMLAYNSGTTDWEIVLNTISDGGSIGGFTASRAIVSDSGGYLTSATTTATEIGYVNGVTSAIQTQLNTKANNPTTITGDTLYASNTATPATLARLGIGTTDYLYKVAAGIPSWGQVVNASVDNAAAIAYSKLNLSNSIVNADVNTSAAIAVSKLAALTPSRAVVSDGSGFISAATTTSTEIGYVNGVTSSIQTQLNAKAANPMTTTGDMIYASNTATPATPARLGIGTTSFVMSSSGTAPQWALLVNANVSGSAAIAGTKISPDFGSQNVTTTGNISTTSTGTFNSLGLMTLQNSLKIGATAAATGLSVGAKQYIGNKLNSILMSDNSTSALDLEAGVYYDGTNTLYSTTNEGGGLFSVNRITALTGNMFLFRGGTSVASAAGSTVTLQTLGTVNGNGLWTLGVSGGTQTHVVNGNLSVTGSINTAPTVQNFTSGSGTYTTPANCKRLEIYAVGPGGGGAGGGTGGGAGGAGSAATTFGVTIVSAGAGAGGTNNGSGAAGGAASFAGGAIGQSSAGGAGGAAGAGIAATINGAGGIGASSAYGGGGAGGAGAAGGAAATNSGGGGGGGGCGTVTAATGSGGGAGGYVHVMINAPIASYAYVVGAAGGAGTAGTSGFVGGAGSAGQIMVVEYYV